MKKVMLSAAVASLFAVSAFAAESTTSATKTEVPNVTKDQCKAQKNTWKNDKCWSSTASTKSTTTNTTTTNSMTPSTTTTTGATPAPATN